MLARFGPSRLSSERLFPVAVVTLPGQRRHCGALAYCRSWWLRGLQVEGRSAGLRGDREGVGSGGRVAAREVSSPSEQVAETRGQRARRGADYSSQHAEGWLAPPPARGAAAAVGRCSAAVPSGSCSIGEAGARSACPIRPIPGERRGGTVPAKERA